MRQRQSCACRISAATRAHDTVGGLIMARNLLRAFAAGALITAALATPALAKEARPSTKAQIDYPGFTRLTGEIDTVRQSRLIDLATFKRMAAEPNTIILDARSAGAYARGHIKGAINLPFTDFTAQALAEALGDPTVRILIYCNNNFSNNARPVVLKSAPLALNIPTFINLVGYGYANVYELGVVVDFNDPAVEWVSAKPG
jgi:rhodanese-related sulfurtransferase